MSFGDVAGVSMSLDDVAGVVLMSFGDVAGVSGIGIGGSLISLGFVGALLGFGGLLSSLGFKGVFAGSFSSFGF